ncbi:cytochrome P450 4V2 [Caerostris darwini]|uniref:Cytochrome P450 4V2 n=1 Tax=Caerostris darwini TaxID=1538125 RepID=A0AAV4VHG4_9ARAC|nr:cytochrome P450 4V2 [Caerostris darwini]
MFFEVVVCVLIGIVSVLALLTLWRKKYSRFVPDNKHSVFQVLADAMDSILFVTSGKKNALHLYIIKYFTEKSKKFRQYLLFTHWLCGVPLVILHKAEAVKRQFPVERAKEAARCWLPQHHAQRVPRCLQRACADVGRSPAGKEFTCIERPLSLCSLDTVCESILGVKIGALQSEAEEYASSLQRLLDVAMSRIWKFWLWPDFIFFRCSNTYRQVLPHLRIAHGFSRRIIKERKLSYMKGDDSRRPKCLLDVLLKLHIEDQVFDEEGVRQEVDTFISAGHESTAVTTKWALYLIGLYPEVQEKIHQELDSVVGADSKGPISIGDLSELKYLECVLNESNRLYPPAAVIARKISEDISICDYKIPKRTQVIVSPFFVHRDEDVFPDPEKFDPERFLPENSARIPECAYIPFAAGPRGCIGRVFAEMEVKILVCHILRSFCLHSLDSRDQVLPVIKLSLQSSQPARIKFRRRQQ